MPLAHREQFVLKHHIYPSQQNRTNPHIHTLRWLYIELAHLTEQFVLKRHIAKAAKLC